MVDIPRIPRFRVTLPPRPQNARLVPAVLVVLLALCTAWAVYQPQRAEQANQKALALLGERKLAAASKEADRAHSINPASVRPLWIKASVAVAAGNLKEAEVLFQRALFDQPSNPETWTRLAEFELYRNNNAKEALSLIQGALYLDLRSAPAQTVFFDARLKVRGEL
jgi:predicted Zn-dependent protease